MALLDIPSDRRTEGDNTVDRLIYADTLKDYFCGKPPDYYATAYIVQLLDEWPSLNIVRCRDCTYYNTACCADGFGWCERDGNGHPTTDNFYCADGEVEES